MIEVAFFLMLGFMDGEPQGMYWEMPSLEFCEGVKERMDNAPDMDELTFIACTESEELAQTLLLLHHQRGADTGI